jgi:ribonuclease G
MSKELFISSTPHETKVAVVEEDQLTEIYYERENEYTLAGSIYKGRVTRVLPGMQSAFVNIGLERDAFLYVSDFLLEEDDDVEGLEQVVSRARVIEAPGPGGPEAAEAAEMPEHRAERQAPLEADEMIPPAEVSGHDSTGEDQAEPPAAETSGHQEAGGEQQQEGSRKWRGRRRRRGRGRFQEREDRASERPDERHSERSTGHEAAARDLGTREHGTREHGTREEAPTRSETAAEHAAETSRVLLPGESISKYQPHATAKPQATVESRPAPVSKSRPSTEYSFHPSEFSPDSMVLPGESISKYRGQNPPAPPASHSREESRSTATVDAAVEVEPQRGFLQDAESAGPIPRAVQEVQDHEVREHEVRDHEVREKDSPAASHEAQVHAEDSSSAVPAAETGTLGHFESVDVTGVLGSAAADATDAATGEATDEAQAQAESSSERDDAPASHHTAAPSAGERQPWRDAGSGVVEEEEIEEEEIELPSFEEDVDLAEYEELEEEVMGPGSDQLVAAGRELTEAVRDAHVIEHATGQYEAEGLDTDQDDFGPLSRLSPMAEEEEEGQGIEEEFEEASEEGEDLEGARAEHRAAAGHAGYQQAQRTDRRPSDRRGGRRGTGGRRGMRGRRFQAPRRLPAISDLLKEGQEILVQIAKEPIAKKGARITSHIALPGRFLVYMPTVHHTGVSRKIASEEERHRLKRIVLSERGDSHGGFIVRTAAAGANEEDLRADIRFLINLWTEIRGRAESSKAPALIYHDLNLVERILRDQVTTSFSAVWADTEQEYERILRFVSRFQPSLVKRVKLYSKETPLFEQFSITDEVNKALKSKVWLKSGGYIVINQTEALVAIDVNTGKYVGKTARLEDTIVKTNIDAIREIVRQIRLRDLGGIIVIDFIDMDERKNRQKVMQALEDALKADRAPSKVLQFNDFGLVAITRKRVKQSLERTLGQPCPHCQATGMIKSVTTVCNEIYVEMRKMSRHFEHDIMLRVNPEVGKALKANAGRWVQEMEELTKHTILVKSDPLLHLEHFDIQ